MKIPDTYHPPISNPAQVDWELTQRVKSQPPLNAGADYNGRYDQYMISLDYKEPDPNLVVPPIVTTPYVYDFTPKPLIDVDALGFTEEETAKVKEFVLDMQQGIYSNGTQTYRDFSFLGIAASKTRYFANQNLSQEKGEKLIGAIDNLINSYKHNPYSNYDVVDNTTYKTKAGESNRKLKDDIYDLFSNLDTTSTESFQSSFDAAQKKYASLMKPYYSFMGYSGGRLNHITQQDLQGSADAFNGVYRVTPNLLEEMQKERLKSAQKA